MSVNKWEQCKSKVWLKTPFFVTSSVSQCDCRKIMALLNHKSAKHQCYKSSDHKVHGMQIKSEKLKLLVKCFNTAYTCTSSNFFRGRKA